MAPLASRSGKRAATKQPDEPPAVKKAHVKTNLADPADPPKKRGPGRPRKIQVVEDVEEEEEEEEEESPAPALTPKKRGRPAKKKVVEVVELSGDNSDTHSDNDGPGRLTADEKKAIQKQVAEEKEKKEEEQKKKRAIEKYTQKVLEDIKKSAEEEKKAKEEAIEVYRQQLLASDKPPAAKPSNKPSASDKASVKTRKVTEDLTDNEDDDTYTPVPSVSETRRQRKEQREKEEAEKLRHDEMEYNRSSCIRLATSTTPKNPVISKPSAKSKAVVNPKAPVQPSTAPIATQKPSDGKTEPVNPAVVPGSAMKDIITDQMCNFVRSAKSKHQLEVKVRVVICALFFNCRIYDEQMIRATVDHLAPPNYFNDEIEEDPYADDVEGNVLGKDLICKFFSDEVAELQEEIMEAHLAYTVWFLKKTPEGRKHMEEMEVARARKKSLPNKLVPTDIGKALQTSNDQVRYLWLPLTKVINDNGSDDGIEFTNKLKFISWKLVAAFCRIGPKYIFKQAAFSVHSQLGALAAASVMNLSQPLSWPLFIFGPRALMAFEVAFRITSVEKKIQTEVLSNPPGYVVDDAVIIQRIAFQAFQIADHLDPEEEPVSSLPLFSRTPIPFGSEFRETGGRGISLDDLRIANHVTKKEREVLEEIVRGITKETPPEELLNESIILAMSNSEGCAEYAINRIRQEDHAFRKLTDKVNEMSGKKIGIKTRLENELASLAGSRAEYKHALCRYDTISQQTEFMRAQVAQARANQYSQAPAQSYQTPAHGYQQPAQQFQSLAHSYQAPAHGFQTPAQNYQTPDFKDPLSRQNYQLNIPGPITGRYHPPQQCPMPQGYDSGPYGQWRASLALDPMQPRPLDMPPAGPKRSPSAQLTQEQTRDTLRPRGGANSESLPAATPKFPARSSTANSEPLPAASMVQNINQFLKRGMGSTAPPNGEDGGVGREDSEE